MVLILFALSFYTNCLVFLILAELFKYHKYGECSDYYRLFCFRQILFLMHSLLVLMKLSIYISGLSHEKVILQYKKCKNKILIGLQQYLSGDLLYYTNGSYRVFC